MRKRIGVLTCEGQGQYQKKLLEGIFVQAKRLDYDVLVFTNFEKSCFNINVERCENNIFYLVNYNKLDGVIIAGDTFSNSKMQEELFEILKEKCHVPVVVIDYMGNHPYDNIIVDDSVSFEALTDHILDVHGCKNVMFYSGSYDVASTKIRLGGFMASMKKHGIAPDDDFICFEGDFWYPGGEKLAMDIIEGRKKRPEAIVFSGDYMAIGAMRTFQAHGWRIPDDIIIVGFDAANEDIECNPVLTSFGPPVKAGGENALIKVDALIRGVSTPVFVTAIGEFSRGGSCGCVENIEYMKNFLGRTEEQKSLEAFFNSYMMSSLAGSEDFAAILKQIQAHTYLLTGFTEFFLALRGDWMQAEILTEHLGDFTETGYPEEMRMYLADVDGIGYLKNDRFKTSEMFPMELREYDEPKMWFFTPLYLGWRNFGYTVISYDESRMSFDLSYLNWTRHVSMALGYYLNQAQIFSASSVDMLTGTLTRRGISYHIGEIRENLTKGEATGLVIALDVDNLKEINDTYGHENGDRAICMAANALLFRKLDDQICSRIGGDEFVILGAGDYSEKDLENLIAEIYEEVWLLNGRYGYPFNLSVSVGGCLGKISSLQDFDVLFQEADKRMYEVKKEHHSRGR